MVDLSKLIMRLTFGGLMLTHGYPKLMKFFAGGDISFPDPIGIGTIPSLVLAVFAEIVCALLVVVGYKTKLATIPLIITMLVAAFIVHAGDPISGREKALLFLGGYIAIALLGPGKYSIDKYKG